MTHRARHPPGMASDPSDVPHTPSHQIDPTKPSVAHVYDCFLGGKDNYEVDRAIFEQVNAVAPQMTTLALAQPAWLGRVTRFLGTSAGIDQFLDVAAGLPSAENTHQAAQRLHHNARVVYVDNDPVVLAHGRVILEENDFTHLVDANLTRPDEVFNHPSVRKHLDLEQPVALIQSSTMHHVPDAAQRWVRGTSAPERRSSRSSATWSWCRRASCGCATGGRTGRPDSRPPVRTRCSSAAWPANPDAVGR
jgi:hypothetical protein